MKRIISTILIIFISSALFSSQNISKLSTDANKAYSNLRYKTALTKYTKIENANIKSNELYYNIGNCYYRLGNIFKSILYYEKALLYNPLDKDTLTNLNIAREKLPDIKDVNESFHKRTIRNIINILSPSQVVHISFILMLLILGTVFIIGNSKIGRKDLFFILVAITLIEICFISLYSQKIRYFYKPNKALVVAERIELKSGPNKKLTTLTTLHKGNSVIVEKNHEEWSFINNSLGQSGWALNRNLIIITP